MGLEFVARAFRRGDHLRGIAGDPPHQQVELAEGNTQARVHYSSASRMRAPMSAGERTVCAPAASSARYFSSAVPRPAEITAPAWPMRLPWGAVTPAIYAPPGLLT